MLTNLKSLCLCLLFSVGIITSFAQAPDLRSTSAIRVTESPKIDGELDDAVWNNSDYNFDGNFYQINPNNGEEGKYKTKFKVVYNDKSIYFAIKMYDDNPELIPQQLTPRDNMGENSDLVGLIFDTYNKGQNAMGFFVSSAGVQTDILFSQQSEDGAWDAVWKSSVSLVEDGWIAEIEIPYFALRFPAQDEQKWGFNVYRVSKRFQEESSWNFIDNSIDGWINQSGELNGIKDVQPPVRLSIMPYLSTIYKQDGESGLSNKSIAGGADLKYGINESFTLDMTLIPDFSQVRSDNLILNLSPFEVQYDENRPFFTEGTEMFSKGDLFYSRRVGQSFSSFDESTLQAGEQLVSTPANAPLINATKLSGRTKEGMGLGVFNAMSRRTFAIIEDANGEEKEILVDPFTNFNVAVVDQNLKNNSSIGIINTNVTRAGKGRDANVTFADGRLRDKTNTWNLYAGYGLSRISQYSEESNSMEATSGHRYIVSAGKVSGNLQFNISRRVESDTWNIRDLGFMRNPNNTNTSARVSYNKFKPFLIFNNFRVNISGSYSELYEPKKYTGLRFEGGIHTQFKNFWGMGAFAGLNSGQNYNYWEPRVEGRYSVTGPSQNFNIFVFSDDRKALRFSAYRGHWWRNEDGAVGNWGGFRPSYRVNDRLTITADLGMEIMDGLQGWVNFDDEDNIIYGTRKVSEITNELSIRYTFNPMMNLSLRVRNYWSRVNYSDYHLLGEDGRLYETSYTGISGDNESSHNANFDAFNIDLFYTWQIAPGSFFSVGYKKATSIYNNIIEKNFITNLNNTFDTPGQTTLSARLIYFLDYSTLKGLR